MPTFSFQDRLFGPYPVDSSQSFAETHLSFAFVNIKPVVPGHVLISPERVVKSFEELTAEEVADLWYVRAATCSLLCPSICVCKCRLLLCRLLVQKVAKVVKPHFKAESLTFAVQVRKCSPL